MHVIKTWAQHHGKTQCSSPKEYSSRSRSSKATWHDDGRTRPHTRTRRESRKRRVATIFPPMRTTGKMVVQGIRSASDARRRANGGDHGDSDKADDGISTPRASRRRQQSGSHAARAVPGTSSPAGGVAETRAYRSRGSAGGAKSQAACTVNSAMEAEGHLWYVRIKCGLPQAFISSETAQRGV